jgi:hypothetical protein
MIEATGLTNVAWKRIAQAGKVDAQLITKGRRRRVVRATFQLCKPGVDFGWGNMVDGHWSSSFLKENERVHFKGFHQRLSELDQIADEIDSIVSDLSGWPKEAFDESNLIAKPLHLAKELKASLAATREGYSRLKCLIPQNASKYHDQLFVIWTWEIASAFSEAGGRVTLTKPGSGGIDRYRGSFLAFALAIMRDAPDWGGPTAAGAFGARLDRALSELRKPQAGADGKPLKILSEGKVLRFPT